MLFLLSRLAMSPITSHKALSAFRVASASPSSAARAPSVESLFALAGEHVRGVDATSASPNGLLYRAGILLLPRHVSDLSASAPALSPLSPTSTSPGFLLALSERDTL